MGTARTRGFLDGSAERPPCATLAAPRKIHYDRQNTVVRAATSVRTDNVRLRPGGVFVPGFELQSFDVPFAYCSDVPTSV